MADLLYGARIWETTSSTSSPYALLGVSSSQTALQTFVGAGVDSNSVFIMERHQTLDQWQLSRATVTDAATDTFVIDRVIKSSNAGSQVSWTAGTRDVFLVDVPGYSPGPQHTITITTTLNEDYYEVLGNASGSIDGTLPPVADYQGKVYLLKEISTGTLRAVEDGGDTNTIELLDGTFGANFSLSTTGSWVMLRSDGTKWRRIGGSATLNQLAPTTTKGDLIVHNGTDNIRVAIGADNFVLTADAAEASGLKWAVNAGGDVTGPASAVDNEIVRFDSTTGKLIQSSGANATTTLSDNADLTLYDATNDGNPELRLGAVDAEELHLQSVYDSGAQTLDYVLFQTDAASATANKGLYRFNVDGTDILDIDDGGIDLDAGMALSINGTDVLDATTLGSGVVNSSLTSVGTIATGTWQGTTIAVDQGGTGQTSYTDGQLLIGNTTGNTLAKATLTGGTGITVTNGSGTITIDADNNGDVVGPGSAVDNEIVRFDSTTGKLIQSSGANATTTLSDNADLVLYDATNDGNPQLRLGATDAEELHLQPVYDSGAQTLDYVLFQTDAASATANKGLYRFNVDGTDILDIDDGGIDLDTGMALSVNGTDIITATSLGSGVLASSLTSVGTITSGTWNGTTIAIANGGTGQTAKAAAFDALAPTTTKGDITVHDGSNNIRLGVGTDAFVLTADSAEASGLKWAANAGGNVSNTGTPLDNQVAVWTDATTIEGDPDLVFDGTNLGVGTSTPLVTLHVATTSTSSPRGILSAQHTTDTEGARIHLRKSRGTEASPSTVVAGDSLGRIIYSGHDGTGYIESAAILCETDGTIDTNRVPSRITFHTSTDAGPSVLTERVRISRTGKLSVGSTATPGPSIPFEVAHSGNQSAIFRTITSTGYGDVRVYNDQNSGVRAIGMAYTGSAWAGAFVTNGPTGEQGAIGTTGNFPLVFYSDSAFRGVLTGGGNWGINTLSPATALHVSTVSTSSPRGIVSSQHSASTDGARLHLRKSRGTNATPVTVDANDTLGRLVYSGYDSANYLEMAAIEAVAVGTIAATRVPTELRFYTATDATPSVLTEVMRISSAGNITTGVWQATAVGIAYGGTGQTTQTEAFDALAPTTTKGDITVHNGSDNIRLAVGTDAFVLTADSAEASGLKWAASTGGGNVNNTGTPLDNQIAVWTNATTIEGDPHLTFDGSELVIYEDINDGNPQLRLGAADAEEMHIQAVYDGGAQTLDYVLFQTDAASATANKGLFRFNVDGTDILDIDDGGIDLDTGMALSINGADALNATTLGSGVVNSSLTSVGTIATGTWQGTTIAVNQGGTGQTSYTDGQLLIGNTTGSTLAKATLTGGTGITVTNGSGTITLDADNNGDVVGPGLAVDNEIVRFDGTTGKLIQSSGVNATTTLSDNADLILYDATNDGNPELRLGATDAEELHLQAVYDSVAQTLDYILFQTDAASATANKGLYRFNVDGTNILDIDDGGIDLATGMALSINGTDVLNATTLGSAVVNSSLTSVGTIATGIWQGTTIAVNQGGTGQISYTDGQLLIGNTTGNTLAKATLTGGTGITVTNGSGTITLDADNNGDVVGPGSAVDNEIVRFDSTTGKLIQSSGANATTTLSDNADLVLYDATNDGTPRISLGAADAERLRIEAVYDSGAQTLDHVNFQTDVASATANRGLFRFNVDGTDIVDIDDGGIDLGLGLALSINAVDVLDATTLGSSVVNSSLTSVGTITSGTWTGTTIAIANGGTGNTTAQAAIDALTAVSGATNEHVLTKDTGTGNAIFKAVSITESQISDLGTAIALVADNLSVFAATTSAQLAGVINDETGSGALVFATSPSLVTPNIGAATGTTLNLAGDITNYEAVNDGNPQLRLGATDAEELHLQAVYDSGVQTLDYVLFQTDAASATANKGLYRFNVDGVDILDIDDGGIDLDTGMALSVNGTDVLTATTLGAAVVNSSLTSVGTITSGTWTGTTIAIANGGTGQTAKTAAFDALAPTTTKGDITVHNGTNNIRLAVGTDAFVLTADSAEASGLKWAASAGGGNVSNTGTPLNNQVAIWTNATTIEGDPALVFDGTNLGVGATTPLARIHAATALTTSPRGILSAQHNTDTNGARLHLRKSRGTEASPVIVTTGDTLGQIVFSGFGSSYLEMGEIACVSTGTIAATRVPTYMTFSTATDAAPSVLTERMRITSAGFVGTGTTAPATIFHAATALTTSPRGITSSQHNAGTHGAQIHLRKSRGTNASPTTISANDTLGRLVYSGYDGSNYLEMAAIEAVGVATVASTRIPTELRFFTATNAAPSVLTQRMVIDKAGLVGIGASDPASELRVGQKLAVATSATWGGMAIATYSTTDNQYSLLDLNKSGNATIGNHTIVNADENLGGINFRGSDGGAFQEAAAIRGFVDGTPGVVDMPGRLVFMTTPDGSATLTERMRITSAGNVGIGTATPASILHAATTSTSSPRGIISSQHSTSADGARLHLRKSRGTNAAPTIITTGDTLGRLVFSGYGSSYLEMGTIECVSTGTIATNRVPTYMTFSTATDAAPSVLTERWRITSAGILQSNGAQTIQASTGSLTLASAAGNGHVLLSGNGTGIVGIGTTDPQVITGTYRGLHVHNASGNTSFKITDSTTGAAGSDGLDILMAAGICYIWYRENDPIIIATNATERMRITGAGNILIGTGTDATANATKCMFFGDNGATNPTPGASTAGLFAKTVSATVELHAIDSAANATPISPHDPLTGEWIFYSENMRTGKKVTVRMEEFFKRIAKKFPKEFSELVSIEMN